MGEQNVKFDFGGYATKNDLKCSDGRVIIKDAFKHCDGSKVPLVWQHLHNEPSNILGHAVLENRDNGVYAYGKFNETDVGKHAKELVAHGDISELSIYANALKQKGAEVVHGSIREVSLVISGANPGAKIDNLYFQHSYGGGDPEIDETEAIIYTGESFLNEEAIEHASDGENQSAITNAVSDLTERQKEYMYQDIINSMENQKRQALYSLLDSISNEQRLALYTMVADAIKANSAMHSDESKETDPAAVLEHAAKYAKDATVQDVFDTLDETQKNVVFALIAQAIEAKAETESEIEHSTEEGENFIMKNNVFDNTEPKAPVITHDQMVALMEDAKKSGSFKDTILAHAAEWGIENIEVLFPDAKDIRTTPDLIKRDDTWVSAFMSAIYKTPFSRIRSKSADLTADEARAKGYITGKKKLEEVFPIMKRITTPTTLYKKQKLDRDDIIDITDFDVVVWLKAEMRGLLDEEIARAILIGDGRSIAAEDKINEQNIRPVWTDDDLYTIKHQVAAETSTLDLIDEVVKARKGYKGSGNPNFYSTEEQITEFLLVRDLNQRRIYNSIAELALALRVKEVIAVEVMEDQSRNLPEGAGVVDLVGIILNPRDYTAGADKGGQVAMFDDFDIDYNQYKYLIETRMSGALTKPKTAVAIEKKRA